MEAVHIQFDPSSLVLINIIVAVMMFGVSLDLRGEDFKRILLAPKAPVIGLIAQFLLLPALTCLACWALRIDPQLALGMTLIAACPGGSFSNIMTWMARGSVAVSVSMTAVSSVAASVLTPLNFGLYAWLNPYTRPLLSEIAMDPLSLLLMVILVLGVPLALGMLIGRRFPGLSRKVEKPLRVFALAVMLGFVALAFGKNVEQFLSHFHLFFWLVVAHNAMALSIGYGCARLSRLPEAERRAITLEVGIQNSALGLVIIFTFFPQVTGMLLIAAFWGCWHLVSGMALAYFWSRKPPHEDAPSSPILATLGEK
ncbi:bile acid:sodium symporter family protein [Pseudomonas sp. GWSMS-1]|uniref:bile acid:sodium symporter family protein n=1 Tax=Pseudomonas sp. GWSMS-1 TaxID=3308997 RepID=UPI001D477F46|nr:bile acid:sodium symporter family protein [Gammaproteobacteria bacterium]MBU0882915.1 bile acid:sodium symporter family protein [Gammaproteobacteria bacterium]MBU1859954.1 bile acid:sodium symporter family protein [Gammaproteobacteria bacterium]